ncbi:MAG TPA: hypothetical protein VKQ36_05770 [Ktedonobacterales bacterium]|nr:hypothetical protein [Ktedonobacterales bacterium]
MMELGVNAGVIGALRLTLPLIGKMLDDNPKHSSHTSKATPATDVSGE